MKPLISILIFSFLVHFAKAGNSGDPASREYGSKNLTGESIYIHTDRELYLAGENLFFCAYLIEDTPNESETSKIIYIALRNEQGDVISKLTILRTDNGYAYGNLYLPDNLQTGYYQLVSFTNWMRNFGEEHFFIKQLFIAGRFDKTLDALGPETTQAKHEGIPEHTGQASHPDDKKVPGCIKDGSPLTMKVEKTICQKGERLKFKINYHNPDDTLAFVSAAIVNSALLHDNPENISPLIYRKNEPGPTLRYFRETSHMNLSGFLIDSLNQVPVAYSRVLLTTPDTVVNLQYANSFGDGSFHFSLNPYYEKKDLFLHTDKSLDVTHTKIILTDKFKFQKRFTPLPFSFHPYSREIILQEQDVLRIKKVYNITVLEKPEIQNNHPSFTPLVYSSPVYTIKPSEFTPLDDLVEISREILSPVRLRKQNDGYLIRLINNRSSMSVLNGNPVVILDGVLIEDINQLIHLNSDYISRIEILNLPWVYGEMQIPGIIAFFTVRKKESYLKIPSTGVRADVFSYTNPGLYRNYPPKAGSLPDFRQLLFWEPGIKLIHGTPRESVFYTGELSGDFILVIEGLTKSGKRISARENIKVE